MLDEATSNVDNDTDETVQATVRQAFKECTVLTIAHRLHTIIDADRILLLDAGQIQEFDAPDVLLKVGFEMDCPCSSLCSRTQNHAKPGFLQTFCPASFAPTGTTELSN